MKSSILIVGNDNSTLSQMTQCYLEEFLSDSYQVFSAGLVACRKLNPLMTKTMTADGYDLSKKYSKMVDGFKNDCFDCIVVLNEQSLPTLKAKLKTEQFVLFPIQKYVDKPVRKMTIDELSVCKVYLKMYALRLVKDLVLHQNEYAQVV